MDLDYAEIERRLTELLVATKHLLSDRDLAHAEEFLKVGEPELALETIAGGVAGQEVGREARLLILELAKAMELTESVSFLMFWRSLPQRERA